MISAVKQVKVFQLSNHHNESFNYGIHGIPKRILKLRFLINGTSLLSKTSL